MDAAKRARPPNNMPVVRCQLASRQQDCVVSTDIATAPASGAQASDGDNGSVTIRNAPTGTMRRRIHPSGPTWEMPLASRTCLAQSRSFAVWRWLPSCPREPCRMARTLARVHRPPRPAAQLRSPRPRTNRPTCMLALLRKEQTAVVSGRSQPRFAGPSRRSSPSPRRGRRWPPESSWLRASMS